MTADSAVVAEVRLADREVQAQWCARRVAGLLTEALACGGRATLAVSGGSTPVAFFRRLSEMPLHWDRVDVLLVDERWVDADDAASNTALVHEHLLRAEAAPARYVAIKNDAADPERGIADVEAALAGLDWPMTVAVLGMGNDGHTASLFPGADALERGLAPPDGARVVAVHPKAAPHPRISLTLPALKDSRHFVLLISGDDKWRVYNEALEQSGDGAVRAMPVRAVLLQRDVPVEVFWAP